MMMTEETPSSPRIADSSSDDEEARKSNAKSSHPATTTVCGTPNGNINTVPLPTLSPMQHQISATPSSPPSTSNTPPKPSSQPHHTTNHHQPKDEVKHTPVKIKQASVSSSKKDPVINIDEEQHTRQTLLVQHHPPRGYPRPPTFGAVPIASSASQVLLEGPPRLRYHPPGGFHHGPAFEPAMHSPFVPPLDPHHAPPYPPHHTAGFYPPPPYPIEAQPPPGVATPVGMKRKHRDSHDQQITPDQHTPQGIPTYYKQPQTMLGSRESMRIPPPSTHPIHSHQSPHHAGIIDALSTKFTASSPSVKTEKVKKSTSQISFTTFLKSLEGLSQANLKIIKERAEQLLKGKSEDLPSTNKGDGLELTSQPNGTSSTQEDRESADLRPNIEIDLQPKTKKIKSESESSAEAFVDQSKMDDSEAAAILISSSAGKMAEPFDTLVSLALEEISAVDEVNTKNQSSSKTSPKTSMPPLGTIQPILPTTLNIPAFPMPWYKKQDKPKRTEIASSSSEESEDETGSAVKAEMFVREFNGHGFLYPGRRGLKSQHVKIPLSTFPGMKVTTVTEGTADSQFQQGEEIVNPVIDLEHHLEYYVVDKDMNVYKNVKAFGLCLMKYVEKDVFVEESRLMLGRTVLRQGTKTEEFILSVINQEPKPTSSEYSILLIETRGKKKNLNDEDKVSRYCEISHDPASALTKFRIGFRICKAQKKKHTKGIYAMRLIVYLEENDSDSVVTDCPGYNSKKIIEQSELFKIVSRRSTIERTRQNKSCRRKRREDGDERRDDDYYDDEEVDSPAIPKALPILPLAPFPGALPITSNPKPMPIAFGSAQPIAQPRN